MPCKKAIINRYLHIETVTYQSIGHCLLVKIQILIMVIVAGGTEAAHGRTERVQQRRVIASELGFQGPRFGCITTEYILILVLDEEQRWSLVQHLAEHRRKALAMYFR